MRLLLFLLFFGTHVGISAQDYFEIRKAADKTAFRYPENVTIYISGPDMDRKEIGKNLPTQVTGNYKVEVTTPWRNTPEIIESNGGSIEITILSKERLAKEEESIHAKNKPHQEVSGNNSHDAALPKPQLVKCIKSKSETITKAYNLYIEFSNGLIFTYIDGETKAVQNEKNISIEGKYLVPTPEGLLKLSFRPSSGETWWVFDTSTIKNK